MNKDRLLLLITPDPVVSANSREALTGAGYYVIETDSKEKAQSLLAQKGLIDLVLISTDETSDFNGIELGKKIQKDYNLPVVFISSLKHSNLVLTNEEITTYCYIDTDSNENELLKSIKKALNRFITKNPSQSNGYPIKTPEVQTRNILDSLGEGCIIIDYNWNCLYINKVAAEQIGEKPEALMGKKLTEIFSKSNESPVYHILNECIEKKTYRRVDHYFDFYTGKKMWLQLRIQPIPEEIFILSLDITNHKQTEERLRKNEQQLRDVIESQSELICRFQADGTLTFVNEAYCRYFNKKKDELLGKHFMPLVYVDDTDFVNKTLCSLNPDNPIVTYEHRVVLNDGQIRWQKWTDRAFFDSQGNLIEYQAVGRDITEHKVAEEKLRESEMQLRVMTRNILDAVIETDEEGNYTYVSLSHYDVLGRGAEIIGRSFFEHIHPDDLNRVKQLFFDAFTGRKNPRYEFRYLHPDKGYIWIEALGNSYKNRYDSLVALATLRDITERKTAEEALKNNQKLMDTFFSQSLDGFFFMMMDEPIEWNDSIDKDKALDHIFKNQRMIKVNQALLDQYHAKEDELIGLTLNDLFKHNLQYGRDIVRRFFDNKRLHIETDERRMDGTQMTVLGDYICIYDEQGRLAGHFGIQSDITLHKKREIELQKSGERYEQLADLNRSYNWEINREGLFTYISPNAEKIIGYSSEEIVGKKYFYDFVPPEDKEEFRDLGYKIMDNQAETVNLENRIICKDGSVIWVNSSGLPLLDEQNQVIGFRGVDRDITAKKKVLEQQQFLSTIVENMSDSVLATDLNFDIIYMNKQAEELFGYKLEEVIGLSVKQFLVRTSDLEEFNQIATLVLNRKHYYSILPLKRKDGTVFLNDLSVTPLLSKDGDVIAFIGIQRDITEKIAAEEERAKQNTLFEGIIDGIPDIIVIQGPDHKVDRYNKAGYQYLRMRPEDVKGKRCYELLGKSDECEDCATRKAIESKKPERTERFVPEHNIYLDCRSNPILDAEENVVTVIEQIRDITSLKKSEMEYKRLLSAVEMIKESILISDLEGNIVFFNNAYQKRSGYTKDEVLGKNLTDIINDTKQPDLFDEIWETVLSGKVWNGVYENYKKTGELSTLESTIAPVLDNSGNIINYIINEREVVKL